MLHFHVRVFAHSFPLTWEQAAAALQALPRLAFEPDGSWIWSGDSGDARWQVDGHLFDFGDRLHRVELHGRCPSEAFDRLLECCGGSASQLTFELVKEGCTLSESEFRQRALATT